MLCIGDDHLSRTTVASSLKRVTKFTLAPARVYHAQRSPARDGCSTQRSSLFGLNDVNVHQPTFHILPTHSSRNPKS